MYNIDKQINLVLSLPGLSNIHDNDMLLGGIAGSHLHSRRMPLSPRMIVLPSVHAHIMVPLDRRIHQCKKSTIQPTVCNVPNKPPSLCHAMETGGKEQTSLPPPSDGA